MVVNLTERLKLIAYHVDKDASVADIGTDHGYIPLYLYRENQKRKIIMTDINKGPMKIAKKNKSDNAIPKDRIEERIGSGLEPLMASECDTIIIAGMGGILIADILGKDLIKSYSFKKYILQPRNSQAKLRKWLMCNGFEIQNEFLVREGKFICEIIIINPDQNNINVLYDNEIYYEIGKKLIENKDPLLKEFIQNKINIEKEHERC